MLLKFTEVDGLRDFAACGHAFWLGTFLTHKNPPGVDSCVVGKSQTGKSNKVSSH